MKKHVLFFAIALISVSLAAQKKPKIKGNKEVTQVIKEIQGEFNALEIDDALEVTITQGNNNAYALNIDSNLVDILQFSVTDSILKIYTSNNITSSKKLKINLTVVEIEHLILKNDAKVNGEGRFTAKKFYLNAYNSSRIKNLDVRADDVTITLHRDAGGDIKVKSENTTIVMNDRTDLKADVIADKVRVTLNNSADLDLNGDADYASFNLKKSGNLNARKMKISSADLYTSNNSDVYINASRNLEVYAQGKSNVYVYGNPEVQIKGLTDKSKIIKR
ncbi:GIN domain-containing protein [Maribacter sp. ACAM166]|uniref:GIN domain-containing protein n=1 Tax=Maribacter sp. ACAM166 TaxID=2508996 RepID=UPI0010FDF1E5|nr:DUF2807 domain-containing protein [Maribacter sp. ACAM166]TLP80133.1 DUF2807 domain-containing protein [Maribacter sp. ACAM166]